MNRLGKMTSLACAGVVTAVLTLAWADEPPVPVCELGLQLRDALGFGPAALAALGVDEETHNAIAAAADSFCEQSRLTVEPILTVVYEARQDAFRQYELGGDVVTTDQALDTAVAALASACEEATATMDNLLTTEQQALRVHVAANRMLEAPLCLLDLNTEQRDELLLAQRTRDLVLMHYKLRKNPPAVQRAAAAYQASLAAILTTEQKAQLQSLTENLHQHLGECWAREAVLCR